MRLFNKHLGRFQLLAFIGLVVVLCSFNYAVFSKEATLKNGALVKLALAPRDPRALMTGDYMTLNLEVTNKLARTIPARSDGFVIVKPDEQGVSRFVRTQASQQGIAPSEVALRYRNRDNGARVGTNAFYFQEGLATAFEGARFGEYRVAPNGDLLLVHMLDEKLQPIAPRPKEAFRSKK